MPSAGFIPHLHAFRGFAILCIVGAHAWSFMIFWTGSLDSEGLKWLFYSTETLFHGSTLYFAIISGLLFSKVLNSRGWSAFFQSKVLNVMLPYIVMTVALTAMYWEYYIQTAEQNGTQANFLLSIVSNLWMGQASIHFWYIPVLLVLFALTPLLSGIQRRVPWLMWILILTPLVISRSPFPDFLKPQSFVYFCGAYALGMYLGAHYDKALQWIASHIRWLVFVAIATSGVILLQYVWEYQPGDFYSSRQSLIYAQKVALCLLVLHCFSRREAHLPDWLSVLGSYAFAIYFVHVNFIGLVIESARPLLESGRTVGLIASFGVANFIAAIIGSMLFARLLKLIAGKHARKLIGA